MTIPRNTNHVSLVVQRRLMQESFPQFQFFKKGNHWLGELKPTMQSPQYLIKISYQEYTAPKVEVISPAIHPDGKHIYPDGSLCLYFPEDHPWRGANLLARTLVAWAAEWLYCYEVLRATGEWIGEEAPHSVNKSPT
jgi:hypothetical protein